MYYILLYIYTTLKIILINIYIIYNYLSNSQSETFPSRVIFGGLEPYLSNKPLKNIEEPFFCNSS